MSKAINKINTLRASDRVRYSSLKTVVLSTNISHTFKKAKNPTKSNLMFIPKADPSLYNVAK